MEKDINEVIKIGRLAKSKLEALDKDVSSAVELIISIPQ
jgi:hypothetical protein